ncbi:polysaccharide biosynthesis tyrosine autokinase [Phenylobacterium sp.]|nr:polysaccharide biosynthesis tyrosine autokinase [Phenylobacterium sp.]MDP1601492.1 polysaccharide biosynthesis tyrosine autokinase [Phenylobacterium sp.]MDP3590358.1 polysaccharide biosynthesis tyrosine autokinase [Phenylobacterium sp.]
MKALQRYRGPVEAEQAIIHVDSDPHDEAADRLDLQKLISAFRRRRGVFFLALVNCIAIALLITAHQQATYTSTARLMINSREQQVTPRDDQSALSALPSTSPAVDSEVEVIGSRELARRVVATLGLDRDPAFNPALQPKKVSFLGRLFGNSQADPSAPKATGDDQVIIDRLLAGLSARRVGATYAIDVSYTSSDPRKAALIADTFAKTYVSEQLAAKASANRQASGLLGERLQELQRQAVADAAAVQQYRIQNDLLSTSGATLTEQEISTYNQRVAEARVEAAADQARLNTARQQLATGSTGEDVGEALDSGVIQSLRGQRVAVSAKVADMQGRYGARHPEILKAQRELADIDAQIQGEVTRVISNLEAKAEVSRQRLASISGSLSTARGTLTDNNRAMVGLSELEQKAAASQALYESYLNQYKQTNAQEGTEQADSRLISEARVPSKPSSPNLLLNLAFGTLLGVGAGLLAVIGAEMLDSSLTTAEDVERRLGLRYLAGIPLLSSLKGGRGLSPTSAIIQQPNSAFSEAYRNLRASLKYATLSGPVTVIAITAALPQEGKTTTSICLARSAALQGQKVVLIDCDVRRRELNKLVKGRAHQAGLLEVLAGLAPLEAALVKDEATGAMILPLNASDAGGQDLMGGDAMDLLLAKLRERFDLVILDTTPVLPLADTRILAAKVDVVVFVARWRKTSEHAVRAALRLLPVEGVAVAGVVLNRIHVGQQARFGHGDAAYYYRQYAQYYA